MSKKKPRSQEQSGTVYQLKVTLLEVKPAIWRRFQVRANIKLADLHYCLQAVMDGWQDCHLHQFQINGEYYGPPCDGIGFDPEWKDLNEHRFRLNGLIVPGCKFEYIYDMGDNWTHKILVEKELPPEPGVKYPICIGGANACPPEDCGGPWGYPDFIAAISDPKHPDHEDMVEWIGDDFDPTAFDIDAVNGNLREKA
jgi:hypothetical protein